MRAWIRDQTNVTLFYWCWTVADGTPKTDVAYNTSGLSIGYVRPLESEVAATVGGGTAPASLAADDTAHTDWGFRQIVSNLYRVDMPDGFMADGDPYAIPYVTLSGYVFVLADAVDIMQSEPRAATSEVSESSVRAAIGMAAADMDTQLDSINDKTTNLPSDPADASVVAGLIGGLDTKIDALTAYVDTEVAGIKTKTDTLPSDPADASVIAGLISALESKVDTIDDLLDTEMPALTAAVAALPSAAEIHAAELDSFILWLQNGGFVRPATTGDATLKNSAGVGQTVPIVTGEGETILSTS